jgi:hypothetical protein
LGNHFTLGPTAHATLFEVDFGFSIAKIWKFKENLPDFLHLVQAS